MAKKAVTGTKNNGPEKRLRDRFLKDKEEFKADDILLELLLTYTVRGREVRAIAQELIKKFGSLSQVLSATPDELSRIKGIGQSFTTLLSIVNFIKTGTFSADANSFPAEEVNKKQLHLFEVSSDPTVEKPTTEQDKIRRKLQISNGYLLEFDQLSRVLNFLFEQKTEKRINRAVLQEGTGLADRQVEGLVSIGAAMGLIKPRVQVLTPVGFIIAAHDIFLESQGALEWCHYHSARSYRNLVWFEVFNHLLVEESPMTQEEWVTFFQKKLRGQYTEKTLRDHLRTEVRFIVDAYMDRNFNKLELLQKLPDERLYHRRYANFVPLVFCAMIYDFCKTTDAHLFQIEEMAVTPGSPAVVFGMDAETFRHHVEKLHDRGWLRYETTHHLDQVRLKPGFSSIEFLSAHFEDREPDEH